MPLTSEAFVLFAGLVLVLYYLVPRGWQWKLLLAASVVYYWLASPIYLIFIGFTIISVYAAGCRLEHYKKGKRKWRILLFSMLLNFGILGVTKYTSFLLGRPVDMIVPLGISFYTFQAMAYLIDVYRDRHPPQQNPFKLALFLLYFPQLTQGPINRYGELSTTLYQPHSFDKETVSCGLMRTLWGYFKKLVIADRLFPAVATLVGSEAYRGCYVLVAMVLYAFELYCDFTGGIDIVLGLAQAMGIRMAENFDLPYFSKNIREYWNRWHITMGKWFTDYIFYPVSVCKPMLKLSKRCRQRFGTKFGKRVTVYLCSLAVWLTTGIWHGASWNFVVWGLTNWLVITASQELEPLYAAFHARAHLKGRKGYEAFQILRTFFLMSAIRMFDCYATVPMTLQMLSSILTTSNFHIFTDGSLLQLGITVADYAVVAIGLTAIFITSLYKRKYGHTPIQALYANPTAFCTTVAVLCTVILIFGTYGIGYDSSGFIYSNF